MMLSSIFTKSLRDRWVGEVVAAVTMGLLLVFTMAIYADVDVSFYYDLPVAAQQMTGIDPAVGGLAGVAYGSIYNLMGALTLAGIAISIGASSIAGEERDGTMGLLLGNPRSRTDVLASKVGAMVVLTTLGGALMWLAAVVSPGLVDMDVSGVRLDALMVHLGLNALLWGMLAVAIGAWTGNRTAASGGAAGVMVASYLVTAILPLIPDVADAAVFSPWYWFSGGEPAANGFDGAHLALQLGAVVVLGGLAWFGLERRDLRDKRGRTTLVDRLRSHPVTKRYADRVAGSARVSSILSKATSDHQGLLVVVSGIVAVLALYYGPIYNLVPQGLFDALDQFPDALIMMIGGADMATPAGWLQGELFSLVLPIGFITVMVGVGAKFLAGEEHDRTMGLLLANPVARRRVLVAKAGAMVVYAFVLFATTFIGVTAGVLLGGLDVPIGNLAAAVALGALLGLAVGAVAFAVGAATGRVRWATMAATGVALVAYFAWSFLPLSEDLGRWANLSPFDWYLGSDPLNNGMAWGDAGLLVAVAVVLVAVSVPLFDRRDLRG